MDRRNFLVASAALAAASRAPSLAQQEVAAEPLPARPSGSLPESIAALASLRERVTPFTSLELRTRIEKAKRLMADLKMGALLLTPGSSLRYFTGIEWHGGERLFACVVPRSGKAFFVCPQFEEERAREQIALGPFSRGLVDVRTWKEEESPFALVAAGLKDRGLATGSIGIDEAAPFVFANGIASAAPQARLASGTPVTAGCRMVKDAHELELMQIANDATWQVYRAVYRALAPGMTQSDFSKLLASAYERVGFSGGASVQTGQYSALPHGSVTPQTIREGTLLMVDGGCEVEGYQSDITRTFVLGAASEKMNRVFEIVLRAQEAALAAAKPGAPLGAIDAAARQVVVDGGYGPGFTYFTHRLGHGIGMDGHEWPYLVTNNMWGWERNLVAQPGMTFSNEPGIYLKGEFGVRLEDDMVITEGGARLFTPQSESLAKPF